METKNTGGPAFPIPNVDHAYDGMSLRDYFAARAMQGIIGTQPYPDGIVTVGIAGDAYAIADAMLKTREQ
jgi:hypothetical protein